MSVVESDISHISPLIFTVRGWRDDAIGLVIHRSQVRVLRSGLGQATYTCVPLSPSSITWYRSKGGDALRLGGLPIRWPCVISGLSIYGLKGL